MPDTHGLPHTHTHTRTTRHARRSPHVEQRPSPHRCGSQRHVPMHAALGCDDSVGKPVSDVHAWCRPTTREGVSGVASASVRVACAMARVRFLSLGPVRTVDGSERSRVWVAGDRRSQPFVGPPHARGRRFLRSRENRFLGTHDTRTTHKTSRHARTHATRRIRCERRWRICR